MIEVQIAGAGAGKTFCMAEKIIEQFDPESHKDIFAITYTNAAAKNIEEEVVNQLGALPDNIKVQTIHTFLLNEIIYPFSTCILDQTYTSSSTCLLEFRSKDGKQKSQQEKRRERALIVKGLKAKYAIHVEDVYSIARKIIDPTHSFHSNKAKRAKVRCIHDLLSASIDKIFLDEAQDLDETAIKAFKAISDHAVDIYMVGDPKQAVKYPKDFKEFLIASEKDEKVIFLPNKNTSRRVPQEILNLSNTFCPSGQEQISESDRVGRLLYVSSSEAGYGDFISKHIERNSIICIHSKVGDYSTRNTETKPHIHPDVKELIVNANPRIEKNLLIGALELLLADLILQESVDTIVKKLINDLGIPNNRKTYAQLKETCVAYKSSFDKTEKYHVSSIIRTKGLESDVCVLVITEGIYKVLTKEKLKESDKHNKTWNMVYVALTRAKSDMIIAIDNNLFDGKRRIPEVITGLENLGFRKLELRNENQGSKWKFHTRRVKKGFQGVAVRSNNSGTTTTIYGHISSIIEESISKTKLMTDKYGR